MKKILILEKGKAISNMINRFFKYEDYKVLLTMQILRNEGNSKLPNEIPDLVIADLTTIKKEKIELLILLKSNPIISMVPFLLITSHKKMETSDSIAEFKENFSVKNYYLNKPFSRESLFTLVKNILKNSGSISPW